MQDLGEIIITPLQSCRNHSLLFSDFKEDPSLHGFPFFQISSVQIYMLVIAEHPHTRLRREIALTQMLQHCHVLSTFFGVKIFWNVKWSRCDKFFFSICNMSHDLHFLLIKLSFLSIVFKPMNIKWSLGFFIKFILMQSESLFILLLLREETGLGGVQG